MSINEFEFKVRGLLEEKITRYRNSMPRKAVVELTEKIIQTYNALHRAGQAITSPVNVGDQLYWIYFDNVPNKWYVGDVPERVIEIGTKGFFFATSLIDPDTPDEFHPYEAIGEELFMCREDAETAIAKMNTEECNHG